MGYLRINRKAWDKRTKTHVASKFYDVDGFINGENSLKEIELTELTDVKNKSLLHLQCHFGLDTLSWARLGAQVTGIDLSPVAIEQANQIKEKTNIDAEFICSDIYEFGDNNTTQYDIVFTSYGALCWLPSMEKWADVVAKSLKKGGRFYIAEFHPVHDLSTGYPYFHHEEPEVEEEGTYTENCDGEKSKMATWSHPISEVINSLIKVGIRIDHLNEFPFSPYDCFDDLSEKEPGRYYSQSKHLTPMVYSIMGTKIS